MNRCVVSSFRLAHFFGSHMVLQRDKPSRVFGQAPAGQVVTVRLADMEAKTRAVADGTWQVEFPALPVGGPHTLWAKCGRRSLRFEDILFGDLWFCSGQSNMDFAVSKSLHADSVLRQANFPGIRHFKVQKIAADQPVSDAPGEWAICTPERVGGFTSTGYFFARKLHQETKIPIGLIHASWGSTPIEAWLPLAAFRKQAALKPLLRMEKMLSRPGALLKRLAGKWEQEQVSQDPGNRGERKGWARPDFDDKEWSLLRVPGFWEGQGLALDGAVWFRRTVKIPPAWRGKDLRLDLGPIDDFDQTYFNGVKVGAIGGEVENPHKVPRSYSIPARLLSSPVATLAVRIFDRFGSGGFVGQREMLKLSCPDRPSDGSIGLAGRWRFRIEWSVSRPSPVPQPPVLPEPRQQLARLYNGMVHAFSPVPIRGFLWYQGESNAYRAAHYRSSFPLLIKSWREAWNDHELPFYFVQLANFKSPPEKPGEDNWAELREAQALALSVQRTGMAVAIDVGQEDDIHPRNKQAVGRRLALLALARDYGRKVADSGPRLISTRMATDKVELLFEDVGKGLVSSDGENLRGFALAGKNRKWLWGNARIVGKDRLEVSASGVSRPVALRYGWSTNPDCNLANSHRLPAAPFRTDDWPLTTKGNLWPF